jgi:hypothetical protein
MHGPVVIENTVCAVSKNQYPEPDAATEPYSIHVMKYDP